MNLLANPTFSYFLTFPSPWTITPHYPTDTLSRYPDPTLLSVCCICTKSLQSCLTLCDLIDYSPLGFSGCGNSLGKNTWSGLLWPPPGDLPAPGIKPAFLMSSALAGGFFTTSSTTWARPKPSCLVYNHIIFCPEEPSRSSSPASSVFRDLPV